MYTILNQEDRNMSKKVYLTSDGYSYHTLELRYNPTDKAFRDCFERLQQYSKAQELYPQKDPDGRIYAWRCNAFSRYGIQVFLTRGHQNMISLTVNPRKLLEPDASYLGIVPPYQSTLEEIRDSFTFTAPDTLEIRIWQWNSTCASRRHFASKGVRSAT